MAIYFEKDDVVLFHGENPSQLSELPDSFVDTIITDPPYGLSFMGKKWDYNVPSIEIWKECLRVLKPGGTALIFAGSRTQHRMAVNVEDAGFILKDCIMWIYGSGFPKATDISKQLDKGHKRKVVGQRTDGRYKYDFSEAAKKAMGNEVYEHTQGFAGKMGEITVPATPEAILWNGWKSHGLKPAYEPILVAMKPNEGTYANNALVHGVSGLNIAGGMIPYQSETDKVSATPQGKCTSKEVAAIGAEPDAGRDLDRVDFNRSEQKGRFPANIILSCTCGEIEPWEVWIAKTKNYGGTRQEWENLKTAHTIDCPIRLLDEQSGVTSGSNAVRKNKVPTGNGQTHGAMKPVDSVGFADKGGASRFFYCAKASKKERNAGCEGLEEKRGSDDYRPNDDGSKGIQSRLHGATKKGTNHHPTVKPLALMTYLCKLTATPTGGTILDPFMGSGTTGVSAKILGRPFIGIDQEESSCEIAKVRIIHAGEQK